MKDIKIVDNEETLKLTKPQRKYIRAWAHDLWSIHRSVEFGPVGNMFWVISPNGEIINICKPIIC